MTKEQKQKIESAVNAFGISVREFSMNVSSNEYFIKMLKAQNALYDAIGDMDNYKFDV